MTILANLSTADLAAELARREKGAAKLQAQRDQIAKDLAALDAELAKLGIGPGKTRRSQGKARPASPQGRPKNEVTLTQALADAAEPGAILSPVDAAKIVQKNGYKSSSATFGGQVANALSKHPKFKKQGRGQYERVK